MNLDSAFARTLVGLTIRPGIVCREYVDGKRIRYTNPVGYLIVATAVASIAGRLVREAAGLKPDAIDRLGEAWGAQLGLLLCVPMAWLLSKLFRATRFNLAENYVFSVYVFAHATWFETLAVGPFLPFPVLADIAMMVFPIVFAGYIIFAARQFYQESMLRIVSRVLIALTGSVIVLIALRIAVIPIWPIEE